MRFAAFFGDEKPFSAYEIDLKSVAIGGATIGARMAEKFLKI